MRRSGVNFAPCLEGEKEHDRRKEDFMKRTLLLILCFAAVAMTVTKVKTHAQDTKSPPLKGYYTVIPWTDGAANDAVAASAAGTTIPLSSFTFTASKDSANYTDVIVGRDPFTGPYTPINVKILLVPMIIDIGTDVYDSTAPNSCGGSMGNSDLANFQNSPILTPVAFDGHPGAGHAALINGVNVYGKHTYNDAHRRAEFFNAIGGKTSLYRTHFGVTVTAPQTITAATTAGHSATLVGSGCSILGGLDINFFDSYFNTTVLNAVGGNPTEFVIFLMHNVVFYQGNTSNCCILGYHGAVGNPVQTYSPTDYDTSGEFGSAIVNVSVAAHEIGEWMDDPLGNNPTPPWGGIGQVTGCQGNWEVGDPLTGTDFPAITMPNGVTYNPQETVFWSWYYSADHDPFFQNIEAGGKYSMNGTFGGPSKPCPPGGSFSN